MAWRLIEKAESDQAPFQLIISDWNAPTLNGLALLKQVRGMDNADAHLPFILITSESHKEQVMEAIQAGVSSFIVKPFTVQMLQQKLSAVHANMLKARAAAAAAQAQAQAQAQK
jgi:two-component system chemotaxis response regulator CheY